PSGIAAALPAFVVAEWTLIHTWRLNAGGATATLPLSYAVSLSHRCMGVRRAGHWHTLQAPPCAAHQRPLPDLPPVLVEDRRSTPDNRALCLACTASSDHG